MGHTAFRIYRITSILSEMPAFFLACEKNQLVGLLTVYADEPDEAFAILVHPNYRRLDTLENCFMFSVKP